MGEPRFAVGDVAYHKASMKRLVVIEVKIKGSSVEYVCRGENHQLHTFMEEELYSEEEGGPGVG